MAIKGNMELPCVIYLATNMVTGKRYIGLTSQKYLSARIGQHLAAARRRVNKGAFGAALRKYGRAAFKWTILEKCENITAGLAREITLIASMKPEYNSTKGGDGARGHRMSPEARQRLSDFHKGRAWHSVPHSEETKKRLSEIGLVNRDKWAQFSALGPKAQIRPVVCLNDGVTHESMASAARHYGIDGGTITKVCQQKRKTAGGFGFKYAEVAFGA